MPEKSSASTYPAPLQEIVDLFEMLPEQERRENLLNFARSAESWAPKVEDVFDLEDNRRDPDCTDRVGIFIKLAEGNKAEIRVSLGPNVQTLTKAMTTIVCRGLSNQSPQTILEVAPDFVPRIIGEELIRVRSRTVYYVLDRIKEAIRTLLSKGKYE